MQNIYRNRTERLDERKCFLNYPIVKKKIAYK